MSDLLAAWLGSGRPGPVAAGLLVLAALAGFLAIGAVLVVCDVREHRLPRRWVRPLYPVLVLPLLAACLLAGTPEALLGGLCGALLVGGFYALVRLVSPGSMGLGDVRLAPALGWLTGTVSVAHAVAGLFLGFLAAGLWAVVLVLTGRARATSHIAMGPWMLLGAALALLLPLRLL